MVRAPGEPPAERLSELPEPTWRLLVGRGLPRFLVEGFVPVLVFYAVWRTAGLAAGVVASTVLSLAVAAWQVGHERQAGLAVLSAIFVVVQAAVALAANSTTVFLAQPVVLGAIWGLVYLGSVLLGRPLIGVFASAWYPFPPWFRQSAAFRREMRLQSLVWAGYCLARAGLRLFVLLEAGVGRFVLITFATGTPVLVVLVFWGLWHARRTFGRLDMASLAA